MQGVTVLAKTKATNANNVAMFVGARSCIDVDGVSMSARDTLRKIPNFESTLPRATMVHDQSRVASYNYVTTVSVYSFLLFSSTLVREAHINLAS
eukprot:m.98022 g.98022  ORF g.98022 m.98022 type:complete len:95 (-) comp27030_c2_seq1:40-324(-)